MKNVIDKIFPKVSYAGACEAGIMMTFAVAGYWYALAALRK